MFSSTKKESDPIITTTPEGRVIRESDIATQELIYESSERERFECYECRRKDVYTRIYNNEYLMQAHYLCYRCATEEERYKNFKPLTVPMRIVKPPVLKPEDISLD